MWRRDPQIILLYDRPLHDRMPARSQYVASTSNAIAVLWCSLIILGTVTFFWIYNLFGHYDEPVAPALSRTLKPVAVKSMGHDEPPSPDMKSPAVLRANADVPIDSTSPADIAAQKIDSPPMADHRSLPKNKIDRVKRKHLPPEASHAYGAAPNYHKSVPGDLD
jgi:hypothetical protein